jgi:hypothetical protein
MRMLCWLRQLWKSKVRVSGGRCIGIISRVVSSLHMRFILYLCSLDVVCIIPARSASHAELQRGEKRDAVAPSKVGVPSQRAAPYMTLKGEAGNIRVRPSQRIMYAL